MIAVVPTPLFTFLPLSLRCHLSVTPLDYKKEAHAHVEGVRLIRSYNTPTLLSKNRIEKQSSSRSFYLSGELRSWVKSLACFASICSSCALRSLARPKGALPHRFSFPTTSLARQVGERGGCANLIRRSCALHQHLHRHATEEEDFEGGRSVCDSPTAIGANGRWGGRRRKSGRRRWDSRRHQVQGQGPASFSVCTSTAPLPGGAGSTTPRCS